MTNARRVLLGRLTAFFSTLFFFRSNSYAKAIEQLDQLDSVVTPDAFRSKLIESNTTYMLAVEDAKPENGEPSYSCALAFPGGGPGKTKCFKNGGV